MFRNWGFLITEMVVLIILAALLGLFVGWLIWGRRSTLLIEGPDTSTALQADLDACRAAHEGKDTRIAALQTDLDKAHADLARANEEQARMARDKVTDDAATEAASETISEPVVNGAATTVGVEDTPAPLDQDFDGDGVEEGTDEGVKPLTLSEARESGADDLKQIKGIGPKLEKLCNSLGFFHFDQIAAWTDQEVAWVDANLEGFKGRVSRDKWVAQAQVLAEGGETEFSNRVKDGGVY